MSDSDYYCVKSFAIKSIKPRAKKIIGRQITRSLVLDAYPHGSGHFYWKW